MTQHNVEQRDNTEQHRSFMETLFAIRQPATDFAMDPARHQTVKLVAKGPWLSSNWRKFLSSSPSGSMGGDEICAKRLVTSPRRLYWCRSARNFSRQLLLSILYNIYFATLRARTLSFFSTRLKVFNVH